MNVELDEPDRAGPVLLRVLEILFCGLFGLLTGVFIFRTGGDERRGD